MKDGDFPARVGLIPVEICRLASAERYATGPILLVIQALPVFSVAVGVVRSLDDLTSNELRALTGLPGFPGSA